MSNPKPNLQQQRDLLQLQADVLRLKIVAEQMKNQRQAAAQADWQQAWQWADQLPLSSLAFKAIGHSKSWRNKMLMGAVMLGLAWLRNRQH